MDRSERAAWDTEVDAGEVSPTVAASVVVQPLGSRVRAVAPDVMTWSKENLSTLVGRSITLRGTTRAGRCYPGLVEELAEANHLACTWGPLRLLPDSHRQASSGGVLQAVHQAPLGMPTSPADPFSDLSRVLHQSMPQRSMNGSLWAVPSWARLNRTAGPASSGQSAGPEQDRATGLDNAVGLYLAEGPQGSSCLPEGECPASGSPRMVLPIGACAPIAEELGRATP